MYTIREFSGGLNNAIDDRNLKDNEVGYLVDGYVADTGKVQLAGGFELYPATSGVDSYETGQYQLGISRTKSLRYPHQYIYPFSVDYKYATTSLRKDLENKYLVFGNFDTAGGTSQFGVYLTIHSLAGGALKTTLNADRFWLSPTAWKGVTTVTQPGTSWTYYTPDTAGTTNWKINLSYYVADGSLRASNGGVRFGKPLWIGVIDRVLFPDISRDQRENVRHGATFVEQHSEVITKQFYSYPTDITTPGYGCVLYTTSGAGAFASFTTNESTYITADNASQSYTSADFVPTTNDFNKTYTTGELVMDVVERIWIKSSNKASATSEWSADYVIRVGSVNATAFDVAKYQYKRNDFYNQYDYDDTVPVYSETVHIDEMVFPNGGLSLDGGESLRVVYQQLQNGSTQQILVEWVRVIGKTGIGVGSYYTDVPNTVGLTIANSTVESEYWTDDFNFGVSFEYDEIQESLIRQLRTTDGEDHIALTAAPVAKVCIPWNHNWNKRITGCNVYAKRKDGSTWLSYADCDFVTGYAIKSGTEDRYAVGYSTAGSGWEYTIEGTTYEPFLGYESKTLVPQDTKTLSAKWKTATVANRIAYIGGVYIGDEYYEDGIFKSYINKFDTFSKDRRLEVSVNDGDEIIHLEVFNDKLFEFKTDRINVINISDPEGEYLEGTLYNNGVQHRRNVAHSEYGLFWMNKKGVYWHDGERMQELFYELKDPSRRRIASTYWESIVGKQHEIPNSTNATIKDFNQFTVIFDSASKILLIADPEDNGAETLLYNFSNDSWFQGIGVGTTSTSLSGGAYSLIDVWKGHNGKAEYIHYGNFDTPTLGSNLSGIAPRMTRWENTPKKSTGFQFRSKLIDMNYPGERKNLYQIYVTSKNAKGHVRVRYSVEGSTPSAGLYTTHTDSSAITNNVLLSSGESETQRFYIHSTLLSNARGKHAFKVWLDKASSVVTVNKDFELEDISLIYRRRGLR